MSKPTVYSLYTVADKVSGYMFDEFDSLSFFDDFLVPNFNGKPIPDSWKLPRHSINLPRLPIQDFIFGQTKAPYVSERVALCMREPLEGKVQFWPLGEVMGVPYYIFNVIQLVDELDESKSRIVRTEERILNVTQAEFRDSLSEGITIFKVPQDTGNIFVTTPFVEMVRQHQLTGVGFELANNRTPWMPINAFDDLPILNKRVNRGKGTEK